MSQPKTEEPHYKRIRRQIEMQIRRGELRPGHRLPGERDLASQFGVSQMTANRALNDLVGDGWLVRRVGSGTYVSQPDRPPAEPQERTLVLVTAFTDRPEEDIYLQVPFRAINEHMTRENCSLLVTLSPGARLGQVIDRYPHAAFIFVAPDEESYATLDHLHRQRVPFVVLGASWTGTGFACVDSDNVDGARTAVEYLIRLGHERIGFVNGDSKATNCRDRLKGYQQGMAGHDLSVQADWIVGSGSDMELGDASRRQITGLLIRRDPVTAVICAGFYLTMGLLDLLRVLQLRVPQDVSIISFDDPLGAAYLTPPLTTLKQPLYAMGKRAVERALPLLSGSEATAGAEYFPIDLIVRGSCERLR